MHEARSVNDPGRRQPTPPPAEPTMGRVAQPVNTQGPRGKLGPGQLLEDLGVPIGNEGILWTRLDVGDRRELSSPRDVASLEGVGHEENGAA